MKAEKPMGEMWHEAPEVHPRVPLAHLPTPLEFLANLSQELGIQLWMKRDDQTGLALGGNKARKLEYIMGDVLAAGADAVITTGGSQSNHARMTAAACRKLGLDCYLVLHRDRHPCNGNLLLDELLGATIELLEDSEAGAAALRMEALAAELRSLGRKPYAVAYGGSVPVGAMGYVRAVEELANQATERGIALDRLYLATSSGGTHAGILAGITILGLGIKVTGISVSDPSSVQEERVWALANQTLTFLSISAHVERQVVHVVDGFVGGGYGQPTLAMWQAVRTAARHEGLLLDPVYGGKAMAGLLAHARGGLISPDETVVFLHTGGLPALFAYSAELPDWRKDNTRVRESPHPAPTLG